MPLETLERSTPSECRIPVVSVNMGGIETNPGFKLTVPLVKRMVMSMVYGDIFMRVLYATRPYEKEKGSADLLMKKWSEIAKKNIENGSFREFKNNVNGIVGDFDVLPVREDIKKPKVGVVGEILVKYHPNANNDIMRVIESKSG